MTRKRRMMVSRGLLAASPPVVVPSPDFSGIIGPFGPGGSNTAASFKPSIAVIIGVLTTMFSLTFLLLLYAKHCKRNPNIGPEEFIPPPQALFHSDSGIDRSIVEALPMFTFGALQGLKDGLECAVCLSRFEDSDILRLLPKCKHAFHLECIDTWLVSHSTCPLCRYCITAEDSFAVVEDVGVLGLRPGGGMMSSLDDPPPPTLQEGWNSSSATTAAMGQGRLSEPCANACTRESSAELFLQREGDSLSTSSRRLEMIGRKDGSLLASDGLSGLLDGGTGPGSGSGNGNGIGLPRKSSFEGPFSFFGSKRFGSRNSQRRSASIPSPERTRRLGHRIIVADVVLQQRWSDFVPSDVLFLHSQTIFGPEERARVSVSRSEGLPTLACPPLGKKDEKFGHSLSVSSSKSLDTLLLKDLELGLEASRPSVEKTMKSSSRSDRDVKIFGFLTRASSVSSKSEHQQQQPGRPSAAAAPSLPVVVSGADVMDSRLRPNQRSLSEITGLERIAHSRMSSRDFLIRGNSAEEYQNQVDTEKSQKWYSIAKRTLNWLVGGRDKRAASENPPGKNPPPWTSGG
ncbi:hypothetical protein R1flu_011289 [Riccia fluitans]|uniref:RING-type E3 ubiquitin transferase n=1 Tax=Riccia fluitans TaxID=41844 RepID=A0ABD1ZAJ8_9MARC